MDESFSMDQQEEQLIASTERMERTSRKLQDAYRIAIETEEVTIIFILSLQLAQYYFHSTFTFFWKFF